MTNTTRRQPAMSETVARTHMWNIRAAYSRDRNQYDVDLDNIQPHQGLINPSVILRGLGVPYIVPLCCDFCGQNRSPKYGINALLWCGECPLNEDDQFVMQTRRGHRYNRF